MALKMRGCARLFKDSQGLQFMSCTFFDRRQTLNTREAEARP